MPLLRTWQSETIWFEVLLIHLGHHRCLGFCRVLYLGLQEPGSHWYPREVLDLLAYLRLVAGVLGCSRFTCFIVGWYHLSSFSYGTAVRSTHTMIRVGLWMRCLPWHIGEETSAHKSVLFLFCSCLRSFLRIYNVPRRGVGKAVCEWYGMKGKVAGKWQNGTPCWFYFFGGWVHWVQMGWLLLAKSGKCFFSSGLFGRTCLLKTLILIVTRAGISP